jgi:hypothetical protein
MKKDFIPAALAELDVWQANFKNKVPNIAKQLNIPEPEVQAVLNAIDAQSGTYGKMLAIRKEAKSATSSNIAQTKTTVASIRALSNQIKSAPDYTEAMGHALGIIGSDTVFDKADAKPNLTANKEGNWIVVGFNKNKADGIHVYSRRSGEKDFSFLAADTVPPYHDKRPNLVPGQAETREYKAWYFSDEDIIGQESDVISITV